MSDAAPRPGPSPCWQTTISERGGIICFSVPQESKEAAMLAGEKAARNREWAGRSLAPDAEVLVELWDDTACRAVERVRLKADAGGNVEAVPLPQEPEVLKLPKARRARKAAKKKRRTPRAAGKRGGGRA